MSRLKTTHHPLGTIDIDRICDSFESAWQQVPETDSLPGSRPQLERYLDQAGAADRSTLLRELIGVELFYRLKLGDSVSPEEYSDRFPDQQETVREALTRSSSQGPCMQKAPLPETFGRYTIVELINQGSFASVYRAYDERLRRDVALKVPHVSRTSSRDVQAYLSEARMLAGLRHPHIVQLHDVVENEGQVYLVSQYIAGANLAERIATERLTCLQSAELIATIADALHHAHIRGLVHRDVKPANILIDGTTPYLSDFGLALTEEGYGDIARQGGTVAYMSPEQARGEGHLVDGRSDVFSLGTVFYELLTGMRPFRGSNCREVLERIIRAEPKPPRMLVESVPKELERICLKALSKRAADRYMVALDMKDDLAHFLTGTKAVATTSHTGDADPVKSAKRIVPRGLRAFEREDADFFIDLLPGPRDRDGLPNSIRFWKSKIESVEPDKTFRVGLIYGPSGCGKSSLIKAGLLPRLSDTIVSIYFDCSARDIETRLLKAIHNACPDVASCDGLIETFAALRRRTSVRPSKVVVVLDQFEHWLHQNSGGLSTDLTAALRHCDGETVQCVLMIRDDFWLAVSRFLDELEVDLLEGQNTTFVDLFDPRHARYVLAEYGRAYGCLRDRIDGLSAQQNEFLDRVICELSQDGKIVPVRLSLFAEMIKGRPWTPETWKAVHGEEGLGVRFLDDTFTVSGNPKHRQHYEAARLVLKSLLPGSGTDIRGTMRSASELKEICGYRDRPRAFDELLHILERNTLLLSPVDPQGLPDTSGQPSNVYYQLTHDYLVHSLRHWLTREQRKDRRGRADLLRAERVASWEPKRDKRFLPNAWEWLKIAAFSRRTDWTQPEQAMMRQAGRRVTMQVFAATSLILALLYARYAELSQSKVDDLLNSSLEHSAERARDLWPYRLLVQGKLVRAFDESVGDRKLQPAIGIIGLNVQQRRKQAIALIGRQLLSWRPDEFDPLRRIAESVSGELPIDRFWSQLEKSTSNDEVLRIASVLAALDHDSPRWSTSPEGVNEPLCDKVAHAMLTSSRDDLKHWIDYLRRAAPILLEPLTRFSCDPNNDQRLGPIELEMAARAIVAYTPDDLQFTKQLIKCPPIQFNVLFDELAARRERSPRQDVLEPLREVLRPDNPSILRELLRQNQVDLDRRAKRQAIAAIALIRLECWKDIRGILSIKDDPRVASYIIDYVGRCDVKPKDLWAAYEAETDPELRGIWIKCLGTSHRKARPVDQLPELNSKFLEVFRKDPNGAIHSHAEWFLINGIAEDQDALRESIKQHKRDLAIDESQLSARRDNGTHQDWYICKEGITFILVKYGSETRAIAAHEVTKEQFKRFLPEFDGKLDNRTLDQLSPQPDCPVAFVTYFEAAAYCNWLSRQERIPENQWRYVFKRGDTVLSLDGIIKNWIWTKDGAYWTDIVVELPPHWRQRNGYGLPLESEWETACLANAKTQYFFGSTGELLGEYAWFVTNSHRLVDGNSYEYVPPVGTRLPNPFGLFDMYGSVYEWCQFEEQDRVSFKTKCISRGGAYPSSHTKMKPGELNDDDSSNPDWKTGLRVERLFPY